MRDRIHELARGVHELPTLPAIYQRVEAITRDLAATSSQVAQVIGLDPVFASRLLRVANSAHYAPTERVTTVTRAVSILGHRTVRETVLVTAVLTLLPHQAARRRQAEAFWRHALGVGSAARVLSGAPQSTFGEECLVAGLLHDIGKLFWLRFFPEELQAATEAAELSGRTLLETEQEATGTSHVRLGRILARHWRLPEPYLEAIAHHHEPVPTAVSALLCQAVQAGDAVAHALELGGRSQARVPRVLPETWQALRVEPDMFPSMLDAVQAEFQQNLELFPLPFDAAPRDEQSHEQAPNPVAV